MPAHPPLGVPSRFPLSLRAVVLGTVAAVWACSPSAPGGGPEVRVELPAAVASEPLDGRLLVAFTRHEMPEPRFQVGAGLDAAQLFGMDVEGWTGGQAITMGSQAVGYPLRRLADLPEGEYWVQAVLHRYETFHLANGKTVKLPMDRGEGQNWRRAPGNLYSSPAKLTVSTGGAITINLDQVMPAIDPPADTPYVRHVRIKSEKLSAFWGRDMYLGAHVLLPEGFEQHPEARYPLMVFHGHFPSDIGGFRTEPPDPDVECEYSERFHVDCYNRIVQQEAYDFYKTWISKGFPRFLVIEIQHANPYYDDSYAVNSANLGPYGDAIQYELIPYVEKQFRGIGEGWARFTYGGSTGGWEALAVQVLYPDEYNGTFAACPDPIDFRAYTQVDLYKDENAYRADGQFRQATRPGHRNWLGQVDITVEDFNRYEAALGSHGRSGEQFDIWQAVFSPMGEDGYPQSIIDKDTGRIDREVAEYWRDNYDLHHILERDWQQLGPKLRGKIHIYCGDMDNYYLNNAVYLMEELLESTKAPPYDGEVDYGDRAEHCWNGDHQNPNHISRLRYNTMYLPKILKRIADSAPPGADTRSWRY